MTRIAPLSVAKALASLATCIPLTLLATDVHIVQSTTLRDNALLQILEIVNAARYSNLHPRPNDAWEAAILTGAQKSAIELIGPKLDNMVGMNTFTSAEDDILIARWRATPSSKLTSIWTWDTSQYNYLILECSMEQFRDRYATEAFLKDLLVWNLPMIELRALNAEFRPGESTSHAILAGSGEMFPPYPYGIDMNLFVFRIDETAYVVVRAGKRLFSGRNYPDGAAYIPERFPPLRLRVDAWSKQRLLQELGKTYALHGPISKFARRDSILIRALLNQDISDRELEQLLLLSHEDRDIRSQRLLVVLGALRESRKVKHYAPLLVQVMRGLEQENPPAEHLIYLALGELQKDQDSDFSEFAVDCIEHGVALESAFIYLREKCSTESLYRRISGTSVPEFYHRSKALALERIKARLTENARQE